MNGATHGGTIERSDGSNLCTKNLFCRGKEWKEENINGVTKKEDNNKKEKGKMAKKMKKTH